MKVVADAVKLADRVWLAEIKPSEVRLFSRGSNAAEGDRSVVLIDGDIDTDRGSVVSFDVGDARALNVGSGDECLILTNASNVLAEAAAKPPRSTLEVANDEPLAAGDNEFIDRLPPHLVDLGKAFLTEVRRNFQGELVYHPISGKFVEKPNNFFTVRIQPRDGSLRVTVRGIPEHLLPHGLLDVKRDMSTYSAFKLRDKSQLPDALALLRRAARS